MKERYLPRDPISRFPIGVDLDATVARKEWPRSEGIGEPIEGAVDAIRELQKGNDVVLYTSRPGGHRFAMQRWLEDNGLKMEIITGKPLFKVYIGDEAVPFKGDWQLTLDWTRELLRKRIT